jgi:hypothetical protein
MKLLFKVPVATTTTNLSNGLSFENILQALQLQISPQQKSGFNRELVAYTM